LRLGALALSTLNNNSGCLVSSGSLGLSLSLSLGSIDSLLNSLLNNLLDNLLDSLLVGNCVQQSCNLALQNLNGLLQCSGAIAVLTANADGTLLASAHSRGRGSSDNDNRLLLNLGSLNLGSLNLGGLGLFNLNLRGLSLLNLRGLSLLNLGRLGLFNLGGNISRLSLNGLLSLRGRLFSLNGLLSLRSRSLNGLGCAHLLLAQASDSSLLRSGSIAAIALLLFLLVPLISLQNSTTLTQA